MPASHCKEALSDVWGRLNNSIIVRGEGSFILDDQGDRYLDFTSGIGVTVTGHCHPQIVGAIESQASQLLFGQMNCMLPEITLRYATALRGKTPDSIETFFFSNSGAEAVEGAVKLARIATGRPNVIAFEGGFHGRTAMTMALTSSKKVYREGFQPLPAGVFFAPFPNSFYYGWTCKETVRFCLGQLERLLQTQSSAEETAAIIIEPVLGEGGFVPAPAEFLLGLREICDRTGILLIVDEIQSGFGRTGKMWAHEHSGISPDILTIAKGIASGLPMSAIGASHELMSRWTPGSHGGTYGGGSAISMAAALATLEVIENEQLIENARVAGSLLKERLELIVTKYSGTVDVRGHGLMVGVELMRDGKPDKATAINIQADCLKNKLMILICGTGGNVLRWLPPLNVSEQEIDIACKTFELALENSVS
ncbi:MAG: aminotransferase class III-fold pyridoxal phosphate-dependent enzyme [Mariniblastus sp.]|nr:aminotransferase class III-fold pyridoxal phosphate-dependent enzyme [Mariniblastus sp.]